MSFLSPWAELPAVIALSCRDRKALEAYQQRRLLGLVQDVYRSNSFYRRLWDESGFDVRRFKGMEDLGRLPPVTKQQLRVLKSTVREHRTRAGRLIWHNTSGSTGEPFTVVRSWREERFLTLVHLWAVRSLGMRARYRRARIRVPSEFDWVDDLPLRILNRLGLYRSRIFSCYETPEELWKQLRAYSPDVLAGYAESVARIARYGLEAGYRDIRPKLISLGGELCTPLMSRQISEAFQVPVYQVYATTEFNLVGWSCVHTGLYHLCDPTVLVEVLDSRERPVAEGQAGTIVGTALHSRVMPFVRFVLGDRVVKGPAPCPCGAPYGTLRSVDGREIDRLRLKNGETLHAYVLLNTLLASDNGWIRQYQLVQDEPGVIDVHIWPVRSPEPGVLADLKSRLEEKTAGTPVRVTLVDGMDLDPSGKFHLCRCSLTSDSSNPVSIS